MCGIAGVLLTNANNAAVQVYDALAILQHRGQEAAGIVTAKDSRFYMHKASGMVKNAFQTKHMSGLIGNMGIGHVRYSTAGSLSRAEFQPLYVNSPYGIAIAHNGNLTNVEELAEELIQQDLRHLNTASDSEVLINVFASELARFPSGVNQNNLYEAIRQVNKRAKGAYAVVGLIAGFGLFGFRDPHGIRPLILGKKKRNRGHKYMLASESAALTALGFSIVRDIAPGEAIFIDNDGNISFANCAEDASYAPCIFEFVYFARPDSIIDNISVYKSRLRMGERLAQKIKQEWANERIDVVVPIPETSRTCALQLANDLGLKYREGFMKNRYISRTFIMPGQQRRRKSVRQKLSPIALEFKGKNVLLVDDSIVRGTTSKQIVQMARDAGAKKVFFASAAPPVRYPNVYGIDMASTNEFVAHKKSVDEICQLISADRLIYQDIESLIWSVQQGNPNITNFDCSCFDGNYVTEGVSAEFLERNGKKRRNQDNTIQKSTNESSELIYGQ